MADEAKPDKPDTNRKYHIFTTHDLDLSDEKAALATLKGVAAEDGKLTVFARNATVMQGSPKLALQALGQFRPIAGDYEVVADSQINSYKDVKTKSEVTVVIGGG